MRTPSPVDIHRQWAKRASSGDLDGLVALYEPGAVLFTAPGQPATGTPAIREGLAPYLALQPSMTVETLDVIEVDDLALMRDRWTLKGTDANGDAVEFSGIAIEVSRRQPDRSWLHVIDNPWSDR